MKELSWFEYLKKSGQVVYKNDNWIWLPRTVGECKELAEAMVECENRANTSKNKIDQCYSYAFDAFHKSTFLIGWSRRKQDNLTLRCAEALASDKDISLEVSHSWLIICFMLMLNYKRYNSECVKAFEFGWPRNSGVKVFNAAGHSILHAMGIFTDGIRICLEKTLFGLMKNSEKLIIEPEMCMEVKLWEKTLSKELLVYLPVSVYSTLTLSTEIISYRLKLEGEHEQALAAQKLQEPEKTDNVQKIPKVDSDELKVLNYLVEQYPQIKYLADIEANSKITRKTISNNIMPVLAKQGLAERPQGKKQGFVATEKGKEYIEKHFS